MTTHAIARKERKATGMTSVLRHADGLLSDFRGAFRSLGRAPTLWATVALTLALGIGVNSPSSASYAAFCYVH